MGAERDRVAGFGRLEDGLLQAGDWYRWGPYVSERQWGTVREDYSADGNAWDYLPHDHARSRAYRWGEDGLAGFCDIQQRLCLALALWNGRDPILKERAFGLTNPQGNHGEDVKEYWWYLDAVPSHAWNRWRYHYPQAAFPYQDLIDVNARRGRYEPEYDGDRADVLRGRRGAQDHADQQRGQLVCHALILPSSAPTTLRNEERKPAPRSSPARRERAQPAFGIRSSARKR
jgi:hypothetical protein